MKSRGLIRILFVLACLCVVSALGYAAYFTAHGNGKLPLESEYHLLQDTEAWQVLSGSDRAAVMPGETVPCEGGEITLARTVFPEELQESMLFFHNNRQCVTVRAEGTLLYEIGAGKRYFRFGTSCYCVAPLPAKGRAYTVEVTFSNLDDGQCEVPEFYYSSMNDILIFLCMRDLWMLILIPLLVIIGVVLVVLALIFLRVKYADQRVISLALFLFFTSVWNISDMDLITLFPLDAELISTISHYMLMVMPIPMLFFLRSCCKKRPPRLSRLLLGMLLGNIVLQTAMFLLGLANLHQMLAVSQAMLALMMFYGLAATMLDYRTAPDKVSRTQVIAFGVSALMGGLTILAYWVQPENSSLYRVMFQAAVIIFLVSMVGVLIYSLEEQSNQNRIRDAELNAYRTISLVDQLTGLKNRRAFDQLLKEIEEKPEETPDALLVFMDLNGLKYANDKFGHMMGDELIIAAAHCIQDGFGLAGETFRIGGDEFAAIVTGRHVITAEYYERMDRSVAACNERLQVPLSIARGCCMLLGADGKRHSISDWKMLADKRMYEDKVAHQRVKPGGDVVDYLDLISSFVSAVDAKDSYTADHSERVGSMTDRICSMLGLSDASQSEIHIAACLHDIGKIGIPDSILCKADKLTNEELEVMQSHTVVGEQIIKHNRAFYEASQIIRHHHERFDGRGYPDGMAGAEIPLGARIIAIADSIDAITSSRSYRAARSLEVCREEIRKNLGSMYDAAIGEIVLDHWDEIEEIVLSHQQGGGGSAPADNRRHDRT